MTFNDRPRHLSPHIRERLNTNCKRDIHSLKDIIVLGNHDSWHQEVILLHNFSCGMIQYLDQGCWV